ncbi:transposase [Sphingomonas sp. DC2300-3]|uniref:transposase n=1 Tax=unclassified Sphingomonas TaxID=196159 RepID=UPI003CEB1ADA
MTLVGRTHLSPSEIAALALDGLPETKRGVQLLAERAGWASIARVGRGGGRQYAVADLPEAARRDLADRWAAQAGVAAIGRPKGTDFFTQNPAVADAVEVLLAERPLSAARILELLSTRFAVLPSRRTLARFIGRIEAEKPALLASMRDPDLYKSRYRLALGRADAAVTHAHQVWEIDTTRADVLCREGRKSILGIVDVWSRRTFYLVVDSESAQAVRRTLIAAITAWGVMPERLRTDQGSGYINQTMATALPLLGIEHEPVPPASGDKKPFVERMFGTFTRERAALLDGFAGHNVAQAAKLRQAAKVRTGRAVIVPELTAAELQVVINAWLDGVYHVRDHAGTGASPIARWTNSPRPARAAPDEAALRLALSAAIGPATVTKRGVQWKHGRYWAAPLAAWVGRQVMLRRDEDDLGAIFVFDADGQYIATAVNAERSGLSEERFAVEARRQQAAWMAEQRAELRAKRRDFSFERARDDLLRRDAEAAGKLATLPVRAAAHVTPMLASIPDAAPDLPDDAALEATTRRAPARRAPVPVEDRIADTDRILAAHAAGQTVAPDALAAARLHAQSSEYRADKILRGPFQARRSAAPAPLQPLREISQ